MFELGPPCHGGPLCWIRPLKLYQKLDTEKESERTKKLKGREKKEDNKIFRENINHFKKLKDLIEKIYYDLSIQFNLCRTKPFIIVTVLKDGEYKCFRYF